MIYVCGRPRVFWVTQRYLALSIYTSSKYVARDFGFNEEGNLEIRVPVLVLRCYVKDL